MGCSWFDLRFFVHGFGSVVDSFSFLSFFLLFADVERIGRGSCWVSRGSLFDDCVLFIRWFEESSLPIARACRRGKGGLACFVL